MRYRQAHPADIPGMFDVRFAVTENILRNRALVTEENSRDYLTRRGRGWVAEEAGRIVGFAIADVQDHNIWALFVHPDFDRRGIGKELHRLMLDWYFTQTTEPVWLSTAPGTRAEEFYRRQGWRATGRTTSGEIRFEMTVGEWQQRPENLSA